MKSKQFTWEIIPLNTPLYIKKCSKCNSSNRYYSSNKFRVNAQKRNLDVWLIYRCANCDDTCNITLLSRTKPEQIDKDLYAKFMTNDEPTAMQYAFNAGVISRNKMQLDYSNFEYDIISDKISLQDIIAGDENHVCFRIKTEVTPGIKITHVIKKYFGLSSAQVEKMAASGVFSVNSPVPLKKCKVTNGLVLAVNRLLLISYINEQTELNR